MNFRHFLSHSLLCALSSNVAGIFKVEMDIASLDLKLFVEYLAKLHTYAVDRENAPHLQSVAL